MEELKSLQNTKPSLANFLTVSLIVKKKTLFWLLQNILYLIIPQSCKEWDTIFYTTEIKSTLLSSISEILFREIDKTLF